MNRIRREEKNFYYYEEGDGNSMKKIEMYVK